MRLRVWTCVTLIFGVLFIPRAHAAKFDFVALGDTAYNIPNDYVTYQALIKTINRSKPEFSIHVGDIWGVNSCTETEYKRTRDFFAEFQHPVIYTPGDNEWIDCAPLEHVETVSRFVAGKATADEMKIIVEGTNLEGGFKRQLYGDWRGALTMIRDVFFATNRSQGQRPIELVRQADVSDHRDFVENALWGHGDVLFGTVHVAGSANNFAINDDARAQESITRTRANVDWIKHLFTQASARKSKAVVIALQAELFEEGDGRGFTGKAIRGGQEGPFYWIVRAIRDRAAEYGKPVLLVHGDAHQFIVDRPFLVSAGESEAPKYANITRLQVFGAPEIKAVRVSVDTQTPWVFSFSPLHN